MGIRALLLDDDQEICESIKDLLILEGIRVEYILNPSDLLSLLGKTKPDVLLLDQNLAGQKGTDWLCKLKKQPEYAKIPIIMLTGVDTEKDKVFALDSGADDYVVKPFLPSILAARIRAVLRRSSSVNFNGMQMESNGLKIDKSTHQLLLNNLEIPVTLTEFKIVYELIKHKNEVLSRDSLRESALGKTNVTDRTIDVHLASLRKKLGSWAEDIKTVRSVGYRYAPKK
ncbi:MAG: response regulator transcription factor [Bdellovibrionaceae bacterium]|nr:response regulator transcription factor [Pseudobdellovibrionaceae bacterium]